MTRKKIYAIALTFAAVGFSLLGFSSAHATVNPPYYFRYYYNHSWCITDPNDGGVGTAALMEHCSTSAAGQEMYFVSNGQGSWNIKTDNGLCLEDPNNGGNGTALIWDTCSGTNADQLWDHFQDSNNIPFWPDIATPGMAIGLYQSNPFAGARVQAETPHFPPLSADTDQEWCVTDAVGNHLVC